MTMNQYEKLLAELDACAARERGTPRMAKALPATAVCQRGQAALARLVGVATPMQIAEAAALLNLSGERLRAAGRL
jgi:hypothetical protein